MFDTFDRRSNTDEMPTLRRVDRPVWVEFTNALGRRGRVAMWTSSLRPVAAKPLSPPQRAAQPVAVT